MDYFYLLSLPPFFHFSCQICTILFKILGLRFVVVVVLFAVAIKCHKSKRF